MITATPDMRRKVKDQLARHGIPETPADPVYAYVNHGRWVADCHCNGAEVVAAGDQPMTCGSCGAVSPVVFPPERDEVERLLSARPLPNQHWTLGQPIDHLIAENIERGLF